ncbi:MAG: hypothetical protein KJ668_19400, partial [Proteobacteria bacterium]|nr:hypothetical protein [Pseudomonadota bacterium]
MKKLSLILGFSVLISMGMAHNYTGYAAEPIMSDYTSYPLFMADTVKPNILIMLDNSGSMNFNAYGTYAGDNTVNNETYKGEPYDASKQIYYGYFNPNYFYYWNTNKFDHKYKKVSYSGSPAGAGYWNIKTLGGTATTLSDATIVSEGLWDGNWLNWLSMRRIDVLRKVLMGGLVTSRTGGGNQVVYGETPDQSSRNFIRRQNTTGAAAVSPYDGDYHYEMNGGYIYVDNDTDPSSGYMARFDIKIQKNALYEPDDFFFYDSDNYIAGVLQRYGDKARWGNEFFNAGTGNNASGGYIASTIGTNMTSLITDLQNTGCDTWTPLAEAFYVATQYFKQEDVAAGLDYPNNVIPNANDGQDPYYNGSEFVSCAKGFVILLTDGASTKDSMIPAFLKDYDGDGNDNTSCTESGGTCDYPDNGTDFLDDVALYAHTVDLRSDLAGDQHIDLYTVFALGDDANARTLLKNAARNGGFEDRDGDNRPDGLIGEPVAANRLEWDKDGDGDPDNYFEATDGYALEKALGKAITDILKKASSGTSVSIISSATEGDGNIVQAYFQPTVPTTGEDVEWVGYLQSLWLDPMGNIREDSNLNSQLDLNADRIIKYIDDNGDIKVERYAVSSSDPYPDTSVALPVDTVTIQDIFPIWETGSRLAQRSPSDRKIFTFIDKNKNQSIDGETLDDPFDTDGEVVSFETSAAKLKPYLGVEDDTTWSHLGASHTNRFENIINFIRGSNSGFTGSALIRGREIDGQDWKLGDIINSSPVLVATPFDNYDILYSDESYYDFYLAIKDRETMVYVGGNDGMIHAFTSWKYNKTNKKFEKPAVASAGESIGEELWAYIPQSLLPHLKWLPSQDYTHVYYADLKPKIFDAKILPDDTHYTDSDTEDNWGTILLAGLNYGGKHIWAKGDYDDGTGSTTNETRHFYPTYSAIDITDPRNPRLLWEKSYAVPATSAETAENATDMGLTTSYPSIVKVNEKWYAVFGSGPAEYTGISNKKGHIFVVDLKTGEPYKNQGTSPNPDWLFETAEDDAFMGPAVSLDKNMNYSVDSIYIGQTYDDNAGAGTSWKGSLYRIKVPFSCSAGTCEYGDLDDGVYIDNPIDSSNPWTLSRLFESPAPVTAAPILTVDAKQNAWVIFGTGRYLAEDDKNSTDQQYIFGIKDPFFNKEHGTCLPAPATCTLKFNDGYYHSTSSDLTLLTTDLLNSDNYIVLDNGLVYNNNAGTTYFGDFYQLIDAVLVKDGWYRTLYNTGEMVISKPGIIGGTVLTSSFLPNSNICGFGGDGYLYGLYYLTGTAFTNATFTNGLVNITIGGNIEKKVIDVKSLGDGLASSPGIHIGKQEGGKVSAFIQTSR